MLKPLRLTRAALETLSIIAYRQPITPRKMEACAPWTAAP